MRAAMLLVVVFGAAICAGCDPNSKPTFGDSGAPKNCKAIIQANIDAWRTKQQSAEDVLDSIERNCGANGYSWGK